VITGYDLDDGTVFTHVLDSQNLWAVYDMVPLLALDVYEHAYVPDFDATPDGRARYVEAFFDTLDWDHVERQVGPAVACWDGSELVAARERALGMGACL
jgi:Fe-Mn family superoxide dismutase